MCNCLHKFEKVMDFILKWEGGFTIDTGGNTKYGISEKAFPHLNILELTKERALEIYKKRYWDKMRLDNFNYKIALVMMDSGVNLGVKRSILFSQKAVNETILDKRFKIKEDGIIGPKTIAAIYTCQKLYLLRFLNWILNIRMQYYSKLASRKKYSPYFRGWINRVLDLQREILK